MSKYETLANGRISAEVGRLDNQSFRHETADLRLDNPLALMFNLPIFILSVLRIALFLVTGYALFHGLLAFEVFVMIFFAFGYLDSTVIQATEVYKNFTKDFAEVRKLWDDFDNAPLIYGYDEGNEFKSGNGTIEVANLTFSY
jgi:Na+/H+ antiporter NhaC